MSLIDVAQATDASSASVRVTTAAESVSSLPPSVTTERHGFPAIVNRSQAYYWTHVWQAGIEESRAAIAGGEYRDFENPLDLARWLLSEEE